MSEVFTLDAVYIGRKQYLMPSGDPTGIFKQAVSTAVPVRNTGFMDDFQADKRVHGGPEKAVHQFTQDSYHRMADAFPRLASDFYPGTMGENLSAAGMNEDNVHIGDIFRVGSALLQVSQPRSPCWKINDRFGEKHLSRLIQQECLSGWYYRVLEDGEIGPGDSVRLMDRVNEQASVRQFLKLCNEHRPSMGDIDRVLAWKALNDGWRNRLKDRKAWLLRQGGAH